jgi:hypothetical protein
VAYMVYQPYTTAVKDGYRQRTDAAEQHARATEFRKWLESLEIDRAIRGELVQQARAIERGFEQLTGSRR